MAYYANTLVLSQSFPATGLQDVQQCNDFLGMELSGHFCQTKGDSLSMQASSVDQCEEKKSWRAPLVMLSSFLFAIILAILHDGMNRSLNGNIVNSDGFWTQQWTSRYGTALAFLIRMFFVTCVGTAFVQRQWLRLSTHQQAIQVQSLDILSSALMTPWSLFSSLVWLRNLLLFMMAITSWTLPFAAVITPGTLSVEPRPHRSFTNLPVLEMQQGAGVSVARNSSNPKANDTADPCFGGGVNGENLEPGSFCATYTTVLQDLANLAFATVSSSRIIPRRSDFANQTILREFHGPSLRCAEANSTMREETSNVARYNNISFLSWVGDAPWKNTGKDPFTNFSLQGYPFQTSRPSFFVKPSNRTETIDTLSIVYAFSNSSIVVECQLCNASYKVGFAYQNFERTTAVHGLTYINTVSTISGPDRNEINDRDFSNSSYKGVLAALASIFVGVLSTHVDIGISSKIPAPNGMIMSDGLATSTGIQKSNFDLLNISYIENSGDLGHLVEETFQNLTLSLFSLPIYFVNSTNTTGTVITTWSNTFIYEQRDLLLAYGISTLASLICCILGIHAFYKNGSSFQNNFSTYIRAAENSNLDIRNVVLAGDTGADPLPRKIGGRKFTMASRKNR